VRAYTGILLFVAGGVTPLFFRIGLVMALPISSAKEVTFAHMTDVHLCETEFWKS